MKSPPNAVAEFRRASVAEQAASALRDSIRQGAWSDLLPGEHELARRLNISRPTVRAALAQLAEAGLVKIQKGCRTRLCEPRRKGAGEAPPTVCLIVPSPRESMNVNGHPLLMEMRAQFAVQGIGWEEVFDRTLAGREPEARLATIVRGRRHVCWLLIGASAAIQRWFQAARVPTLVLGSCHAGVELPSVDVNYYAIGWHAAGCLSRQGHRTVALVLPHRLLAGDMECVRGLTEYGRRLGKEIAPVELSAVPSRTAFFASLDRLLARPQPPTAIFCIHVPEMLAVLVHVLRSGRRVPRDLSLMCRETRPSVDQGLPEITRYRSPVLKQARQAVRMAQSMLAGHHVPTKPHRIMPAFVPGETLARNPART